MAYANERILRIISPPLRTRTDRPLANDFVKYRG
jgi:hypothetical protein